MVPGDGAQLGKEITLDGTFTVPECIEQCSKIEGANGITMTKRATDKAKGTCYCELGMRGVNLGENPFSTSFKTCFLKVSNLELSFGLGDLN